VRGDGVILVRLLFLLFFIFYFDKAASDKKVSPPSRT
jgi:hypothetical protein